MSFSALFNFCMLQSLKVIDKSLYVGICNLFDSGVAVSFFFWKSTYSGNNILLVNASIYYQSTDLLCISQLKKVVGLLA